MFSNSSKWLPIGYADPLESAVWGGCLRRQADFLGKTRQFTRPASPAPSDITLWARAAAQRPSVVHSDMLDRQWKLWALELRKKLAIMHCTQYSLSPPVLCLGTARIKQVQFYEWKYVPVVQPFADLCTVITLWLVWTLTMGKGPNFMSLALKNWLDQAPMIPRRRERLVTISYT